MLLKEYRICMPLTTEEYQRGQQYMINRHSDEQSEAGEGVEVVCNEPHYDEVYGHGKYTEKRIHLNSRLPSWARAVTPSIYVTEKAWNYYPYTVTEYSCHFLPRLTVFIETRYEDNNGKSASSNSAKFYKIKDQGITDADLAARDIDHLDIAYDKAPDKSYKESEDCTKFHSKKTNRGPLRLGWRDNHKPIMCSFKLVLVKFEVWGLQSRVESFIQKSIRDILLVGHRQAFAWVDLWYDMTPENIKQYELELQAQTNSKVLGRKRSSRSSSKKSSFASLSSFDSSHPKTPSDSGDHDNDDDDLFVDATCT
uniref:cytoplasmic phosphatidylinositol transfer protein 1-like n=1 Tax=Styela clava TaxID=7725 RepID=UPI0019397BEB|nr:cytoplasmic phosphatidylinositol transfer protein 1-like [Styela clava]